MFIILYVIYLSKSKTLDKNKNYLFKLAHEYLI